MGFVDGKQVNKQDALSNGVDIALLLSTIIFTYLGAQQRETETWMTVSS